ncbi:hypothetical protein Mapa_003350 [Marchantia paleacea]|nr:hypothetical protein Mapa_003350 [Marchantia paleacea]
MLLTHPGDRSRQPGAHLSMLNQQIILQLQENDILLTISSTARSHCQRGFPFRHECNTSFAVFVYICTVLSYLHCVHNSSIPCGTFYCSR